MELVIDLFNFMHTQKLPRPLVGKSRSSSLWYIEVMANNCCVRGCKNYVGKKDRLGFFRFPLAESRRCTKWEAVMRRGNWHNWIDLFNFTHAQKLPRPLVGKSHSSKFVVN